MQTRNEGGVMDIQNFIDEFKKTFIYDILCESLEDEQLFEHTIVGNQVIWMKEQTRQMWFMWQQAQKVAVPETNISFKDWISDHKNDYVHFGGYQERAHELANRAWNASANALIPEGFVLVPKEPTEQQIDYVVDQMRLSGGLDMVEQIYKAMIEAQEQAL